jgi:formylglycine-generating enzyme required for sulfatase activity
VTLKELRFRTHKNLQVLKERRAKQGTDPDLKLLNEIEDHEAALALLDEAFVVELNDRRLEALKKSLRPLLIATNVESISVEELEPTIPPLPFEPETVIVPAGPFLLGCEPGAGISPEESPQHEVHLEMYQIGKCPVTNAQYAEFIKQQPRHYPLPKRAGWDSLKRRPAPDTLDHPVVWVNWYEALAYCRWLSEQTKRRYRLPSEAEWEKAASWVELPQGEGYKRVYPWGDDWHPDYCHSDYNLRQAQTVPVTTHAAGVSDYGCYDMVGNVQEWTSTIWGSDEQQADFVYPYQASDGRENLEVQDLARIFRVQRGGLFNTCSCTVRDRATPETRATWLGFRVVLER